MPLLDNCYIWTQRRVRNPITGGTAAPTPYLSMVSARIDIPSASELSYVPASVAGVVQWRLDVDVDVDIVEGDVLLKVTEQDGATVFPRSLTGMNNYSWAIRYVDMTPPLLFPRRRVYLSLVRDGR